MGVIETLALRLHMLSRHGIRPRYDHLPYLVPSSGFEPPKAHAFKTCGCANLPKPRGGILFKLFPKSYWYHYRK